MRRIQGIILAGSLLYNTLFSQIAPGQWREILPYYEFTKIVPAGHLLYCPARYGIMVYDCLEESYSRLSKINGLSETDIADIAYYPAGNCLLVGYLSSNIDIIRNKEIINMPDIKNKSSLTGKSIYGIRVIGSLAYVCCSFGIVVIDLEKLEIKDTYYPGDGLSTLAVYDICLYNDNLYSATRQGIYRAAASNPNLGNYANWTRDNSLPYPDSSYSRIVAYHGKLYALRQGTTKTLYVNNGNGWMVSSLTGAAGITNIDVTNGWLMLAGQQGVYLYGTDDNLQYSDEENGLYYGTLDNKGNFWVSNFGGIKTIKNNQTEKLIYVGGPWSAESFAIASRNGTTWIAHGGCLKFNFLPMYLSGGISVSSPDGWMLINKAYYPALDKAFDFIDMAIHPSNPAKAYGASLYGEGLYEFDEYGKKITIYTAENTRQAIQTNDYQNGLPRYRIGGLSFDQQNNLWFTLQFSPTPLVVMKSNGTFKSFTFNGMLNNYQERGAVLATSSGTKWIVLGKGKGLFVFDDNHTIDNESDDTYRLISVKVSEVENPTPYNDIRSIAEDHDGYIWLGTANGPVVYYNPYEILSKDISAARIKVPKYDGKYGALILLENETINDIAVDGGNRKWFATANSGAFLVSPDGKKQLFNFREENSPVFSNNILSVAVDNKTGEVFLGTSQGTAVYRGNATEGENTFGKIYVFPNPVRENYEGEIIITGLVENTNVKITDIAGNLVYETTSNGGQASWNGKTFSGQRVYTGVYLVFCTSADGSQTYVTKLLFIH